MGRGRPSHRPAPLTLPYPSRQLLAQHTMHFNLALAQQAASLCRDQPTASPEYAQALGVQQNVLDAQLAMLVDAAPNEPAAAHLSNPDALVSHLMRQRLRLDLQCVEKGTLPVAQQRSLLRAMARTGTASLGELASLGSAAQLRELVDWHGLPNGGFTVAQGWHGSGTVKNGEAVLTLGDACQVVLWGQAHKEAVQAAAAAGPAGAPAPPKLTFSERLAAAGYDRIPAAARPTQTMVDTIVNLRASKKRVCPYVFSKLEPWTDRSWSQTSGHTGGAHAIHEQACLEDVGAQLAAATGGTFDASGAVAAAALSTATKMAASYDPAGKWWAAVTRVAHSLAIAGAFGPGGIAVATAYLVVLGLVAARHGMDFAKSYDAELRLLAASSEEYTEEKVAALFSSLDLSVMNMLQTRPRPA